MMYRFCFAAVVLTAASVQAATLIPVPPVPGASRTSVFDINDNNVIAGVYDSGGTEHAFFGDLRGNYQTFDFAPTGGTEARAIDNTGRITGIANYFESPKYCKYMEFERSTDGTIASIKRGTSPLHGIVQGFTLNGKFVGDRCKQGTVVGYEGRNAKYSEAVAIGISTSATYPRDINANGDVVGDFINSTGADSAFLLKNGVTSVIDYPNSKAVNTVLQGLNNGGTATGHWDKGDFQWQAFALDTNTSTFTSISVPGASYVQAFGINKAGLIAVDASNGPYIFCPSGAKCPAAARATVAVHLIRVSPGAFLRFDIGKTGRRHSRVARSGPGQVNADGLL